MSFDSQRPLINGPPSARDPMQRQMAILNDQLKHSENFASFHGDALIGDKWTATGFLANLRSGLDDFRRIFLNPGHWAAIGRVGSKLLAGQPLDVKAGASLIGSMSNDSVNRAKVIEDLVQTKYDRMLHPPLTYLGDAFQYRAADGKYNSVLHPHLGQAGAPYAKTVPSKTHPLGALPDPGDLFDRLMAREEEGGRPSTSGLSAMLIYHATIIIHDIFRTNDSDKNISDSSSYLDLSPLYGYTMDMQREVRDDKYKLGLLKPDTFAEDRLLRQPPGVCIMLVMYNRYHNYAATQIRRINENGRFSVPAKYDCQQLVAIAKAFVPNKEQDASFEKHCKAFTDAHDAWEANDRLHNDEYEQATKVLQSIIDRTGVEQDKIEAFKKAYDAAWNKLDDDLFNTARLITCGMYVQIAIHDYLRALMGFHQYDTNFTLDPRIAMNDRKNVTRGLGNQVTVEFNLLYRFHCAISGKDEKYTESFMRENLLEDHPGLDPKTLSLQDFLRVMGEAQAKADALKKKGGKVTQPWERTFGIANIKEYDFQRNPITGLFNDQAMIDQLKKSMEDPISNFGPKNVPRCLRAVEIMGITQARKWEIGTLNDFREFFGLRRHQTFESITTNKPIADGLRDLYEHPDKVELYPGAFCESDSKMNVDPGPSDTDSALWAAIFSDAITLVRSDRFYTVDWNTNSLTSWGMKEVTEDNDNLKSSVYHRLLQRAFPGWFPYNSIHFFHPFYTAAKNLEYAQAQGYVNDFKLSHVESKGLFGRVTKYGTSDSAPDRPEKPLYLKDHNKIAALLADTSGDIVHPAYLELDGLPLKVQDVMKSARKGAAKIGAKDSIQEDTGAIINYFTDLMHAVITRETITMNETPTRIYQIDITRDFAIPVTTRYVADLLGFGHKVKSEAHPHGLYSENEIYQHITNCQIFFSYNTDETKLLKRRKAYRASMKFLYELAKDGNILEASRWDFVRLTGKSLRYLFGRQRDNPMTVLGFRIAKSVLKNEPDAGKAAAIFLLIALDAAYNSVLAFTSVLDALVEELYKSAGPESEESSKQPKWSEVQELAFQNSPESIEKLKKIVLEAQRESVRFPLIRKCKESRDIKDEKGQFLFKVEKGKTVICDVHQAVKKAKSDEVTETDYLNYQSSFAQRFTEYNPKHIAILSLTTMIKVVAQMKNLRRGHETQGKLKKVHLDSSLEGYSNFMAPARMRKIKVDVEKATKDKTLDRDAADDLFSEDILRPASDTFLTPEWDEMVPFPTTWKLRFDGFGISDYGGPKFELLKSALNQIPDFIPPFYQPRGASHTGGTLADVSCVCNGPNVACKCKDASVRAIDSATDGLNGHTNGNVVMPAHHIQLKFPGCGVPGQ